MLKIFIYIYKMRSKFRFDMKNIDWVSIIIVVCILVVLVLSILILNKVDKTKQGYTKNWPCPILLPTTGWGSGVQCTGNLQGGLCYTNKDTTMIAVYNRNELPNSMLQVTLISSPQKPNIWGYSKILDIDSNSNITTIVTAFNNACQQGLKLRDNGQYVVAGTSYIPGYKNPSYPKLSAPFILGGNSDGSTTIPWLLPVPLKVTYYNLENFQPFTSDYNYGINPQNLNPPQQLPNSSYTVFPGGFTLSWETPNGHFATADIVPN